MRLVNWRTLVVAAAGMGLAACGDDVSITPPTLIVTPAPAQVTCTTGQTVSAGVNVSGGSGTSTVTFTGTGVTVTGSGTSVTIVCGNTAGAGTVTYQVTNGSQVVNGSIPVTITQAGSPVLAVSINPQSLTLPIGGTGTLTATVSLAPGAPAGTATTVTWSSTDQTVATVNATTGVVTGVKAGQTVIRATSTANTNLTASVPVTVTATSSTVGNLAVSPQSINVGVGGTQQLTTNVTLLPTAPAGTSTAVTCRSSNTSVVTVTASGCLITGVAAGSGTITVLAAADTNVRTTVGVTVAAPAPVRITIQSLRVTNAAGNLIPADQSNVAGNVQATLNLDPGDFRPDSVRLRLGSSIVVCQRFSAQLAQAFSDAIRTGSADVQPIECQLNTAAFDTTTGTPRALNGTQTLTAEVFYRPQGGGASTTQSATIGTQITLNNQSGFYVAVTNAPSAAQVANGGPANGQATGPQSVLWRAGSITVSVLPVTFTGASTPGNAQQAITVSLVDPNGTIASNQAQFSAGAAATTTFAGTTGAYTPNPGNNTLTGYTSPNAGAVNGGTQVQIGGGANAVVLNISGTPQAASPAIFIDNAYPEPRAQFVSGNFLLSGTGTSGFLNGSFAFADSVQQMAATTTLADNNGVDRVARAFFYAANSGSPTAAQILAGNLSATNANGSIAVPANTTINSYVAAARLADALGNAIAVPVTAGANGANGVFTFGVSTAAPTLTVGGTGANNGQYGIATTTARTVTATVTSPVGFGRNPSLFTVTRVSPNGTFCAAAGTADVTTNAAPTADVIVSATTAAAGAACPTVAAGSISIDPTTAAAGIYTVTVQSRDVAGNVSATTTRTFVIDRVAPTVVNAIPATVPIRGGQPATFTAQATDNLSITSQLALVEYPTANAGTSPATPELLLRYPGTSIGSAFATPFTSTANLSVTVPAFIRAVAFQAPSAANTYTNVGNSNFITTNGAAVGAVDAGGNTGYASISGAALQALLDQTQTAPAFFGGTGMQNVSIRYTPNDASGTVTTYGGTFAGTLYGGAGTTTTPSALTITLRQSGVANTPFSSPFTRIEIYQRSATPGQSIGTNPFASQTAYTFLGTATQGGLTVSPGASTIDASFTYTPTFPSTTTGPITSDLLVVASDANGYAIAFVIPTLTLNP